MASKILLVEDEKKLALIIRETLGLYAFDVVIASDGVEGVKFFSEQDPSLVILDIMLPRMDGYEVLQKIRNINRSVPVIMLTARSQTVDLVKGFELGCNDYIKKPFIMDELLARVRSLLLNSTSPTDNAKGILTIGRFVFNIANQELRSPSQIHNLSFKETEVLKRLLLNPNKILDRKGVLLELWGDDNLFNSRNLNVYITKLRNYFKEDENVAIINLRGLGYKIVLKS